MPADEGDDATMRRIAAKEARERIDRILAALRQPPGEPSWEEIFREAHTLAGMAGEVDAELASLAREVASRLRDARGEAVALGPDEARAVLDDVARMARRRPHM